MKKTFVFAATALVAGATMLSAETTVECENITVTIDDEQTMMIKEATGEENFGKDVCMSLANVDTSNLTGPTDSKVLMSNGMEYDVKLAPPM
jgi:hypothetical protein